jgi:hypothetical protein
VVLMMLEADMLRFTHVKTREHVFSVWTAGDTQGIGEVFMWCSRTLGKWRKDGRWDYWWEDSDRFTISVADEDDAFEFKMTWC